MVAPVTDEPCSCVAAAAGEQQICLRAREQDGGRGAVAGALAVEGDHRAQLAQGGGGLVGVQGVQRLRVGLERPELVALHLDLPQ